MRGDRLPDRRFFMDGIMSGAGGRPTAYKPEYAEQAFKLALLGAKDKEIADFFEVADSTLNLWKNEHPEFSESLNDGKRKADSEIAKSLYHRAKGYEHEAVKIFCSKYGDVTEVKYTERYAPDTTACIFWLKNRQKAEWRDTQQHEVSGPDGQPMQSVISEKPLEIDPFDKAFKVES